MLSEQTSPLRNILVVDDEPAIRTFAGALLQELGYNAVLADGGRAAVQLVLQDPEAVAAVLLDMTMPGMRPEETWRLLHEIRADLPVLILSGEPESAVRERFGPGTIAGYISKPDMDLELESALANALTPNAAQTRRPFELARLPEDEMDKLRQEYVAKCRRELPLLTDLLAAGDFERVRVIGHTLKGSGGSFGLTQLTEVGRALEEYANAADQVSCGAQVRSLSQYLENTTGAGLQSGGGQQ
jgi:CheY-like chemotaxis protein